jgi:proteic killer suppression protein
MAIKSFKGKNLKRFWAENDPSGLNPAHVEKISIMLDLIDAAVVVQDLRSFYRFHEYTGGGKGVYSFSVSGNFRLLFRFHAGEAFDLWYGDPHGMKIERIMGKS